MFRGAWADYDVACDGGACVVVDSAADRDGTTTTDGEVLSFDDGDYDGGCGAPRGDDAAAACWFHIDYSRGRGPAQVPRPAEKKHSIGD